MSNEFPFDISRFSQFLPKTGDRDLILLKGHLLVEEVLRTYLYRKFPKPEELSNPKYFLCLRLTKAFETHVIYDWLWDALKILNEIRNKLAHNLEPK